jgi:hypothetical protein
MQTEIINFKYYSAYCDKDDFVNYSPEDNVIAIGRPTTWLFSSS